MMELEGGDYTKPESDGFISDTLYGRARLQFVRKVYIILASIILLMQFNSSLPSV